MSRDDGIEYYVAGIAGRRHPRCARGTVLLRTSHTSMASAQVEVAAWQTGMKDKPGQVERCDLTNKHGDTVQIFAETKVVWKHG